MNSRRRKRNVVRRCGHLLAWCLALLPSSAWAGMPSPLPVDVAKALRLTEAAAERYQAISFFLLVLVLSSLLLRWLWNRLSADFPRLPRLSFPRSLAMVVAWGMLFLVVLTMIAGTRELMTPGVWQKEGLLYHVPSAAEADAAGERPMQRAGWESSTTAGRPTEEERR